MTDALTILQTAIESSVLVATIIVVAVFALLAWVFSRAYKASGQGDNPNE